MTRKKKLVVIQKYLKGYLVTKRYSIQILDVRLPKMQTDVDSLLNQFQSMKELKAHKVIARYWRRYRQQFCRNQFQKKTGNIKDKIGNLMGAGIANM